MFLNSKLTFPNPFDFTVAGFPSKITLSLGLIAKKLLTFLDNSFSVNPPGTFIR
jgi:hypothetical protein